MTCVVLLSGGMDSAVALHWAIAHRRPAFALAIDYGQPHRVRELAAAREVAKASLVPLREGRLLAPWPPMQGDVVVGRNLHLLNAAAAQGAVRGGGEPVDVVIGCNLADAEGFPDCRPEFLRAAGQAIGLGIGVQVQIVAPFIASAKAQIVREARELGPAAWHALRLSWSCYRGGDAPCGECGACVKRAAGFAAAGEEDPWRGA